MASWIQFLLWSSLLFAVNCNGQEPRRRRQGQSALSPPLQDAVLRRAAATPSLRNLEVAAPVYLPTDSKCQQALMVYSFGNSFGKPYVGPYSPPSCDFNRVVLNFTVTSKGRQFDRLALMYLNDTEVFRTSTAEPTLNGIIWTYMKDVSALLPLFKEDQKLIFDLGNIIDETYTGFFNTSLTATFFTEDKVPPAADVIVPISARTSATNLSSAFLVPATPALNNITLPRNIKKAYFTLSACGQANEEFWWSNVLNSTNQTFSNTTLLGFSSWREVQLLIDDTLAGVAWPFPVIFTGGVVPGFWRPVAGIDAFDLKEDEIDISPFLPKLADGKNHKFEMRVVGLLDDGRGGTSISPTVGDNWVVTGKIFLWLDGENSTTTGTVSTQSTPDPEFQVASGTTALSNGTNATLSYSVLAQRNLEITSRIKTSAGEHEVSWKQSISFSNMGNFTDSGNTQVTSQMTSGAHSSSNGYSIRYSYPLIVNDTFSDQTASGGNMTISGTIDRSKDLEVTGRAVFLTPVDALPPALGSDSPPSYAGYSIRNRQNATAFVAQNPDKNISVSMGTTEQVYDLRGQKAAMPQDSQAVTDAADGTVLYNRHVIADNATVMIDEESPAMKEGFIANDVTVTNVLVQQGWPKDTIRDMLGRGPRR